MTREVEQYQAFFADVARQATALIEGVPPAGLNWRPLQGEGDEATNSLAATLAHLTGSVRFWIGEMLGGRPAHRDRDAEFRVQAESAESLQGLVDEMARVVREVLSRVPPEALEETITARGERVTRRWALIHGLEHASVHLGHMQITRQLWEKEKSN